VVVAGEGQVPEMFPLVIVVIVIGIFHVVVTNFIWPYLHPFFDDFHSLNGF